ncbi:MAG: urease accessory protein UreD, partial [Spongiibacteraceae bacterium]
MNARQPTATELSTSTWPAQLRLWLEQRPQIGTRLVECTHSGPLRIQRPFYPEGSDCAHLYILHPPGGMVSGDDLAIDVQVGAHAAALLTTPGAGRIYRARTAQPARQIQRVLLHLEEGAALEWLPQSTIVFDGADVLLDLQVNLAANSSFIGWETICLGRPASQLSFERGRIEQRWRVLRDDVPLLNDRLCIRGDDHLRNAAWGLQKFPVYGTFLAVPGASQSVSKNVIETLRELIATHGAD